MNPIPSFASSLLTLTGLDRVEDQRVFDRHLALERGTVVAIESRSSVALDALAVPRVFRVDDVKYVLQDIEKGGVRRSLLMQFVEASELERDDGEIPIA